MGDEIGRLSATQIKGGTSAVIGGRCLLWTACSPSTSRLAAMQVPGSAQRPGPSDAPSYILGVW